MTESNESPQETESQGILGFPAEVYERNGNLYRDVTIGAADGTERIQVRPVAKTLAGAKARRQDFYFSEELGWILNGYKWERDRSVESIMADGSAGIPMAVDRQEQIKQEALSDG